MCVHRTVTTVQTLSWGGVFFSLSICFLCASHACTDWTILRSTGYIQLWRCSKETCRVLDRYGRRFFPSGCRLLRVFANDPFLSDVLKDAFREYAMNDCDSPFNDSSQRMNFWNTREWWSSKPTAGSKPALRHWCCAILVLNPWQKWLGPASILHTGCTKQSTSPCFRTRFFWPWTYLLQIQNTGAFG